MLKLHAIGELGVVVDEGPAVLPYDRPGFFQDLKILPDGGFGDIEQAAELIHPAAPILT
jgi:hypothetical protein